MAKLTLLVVMVFIMAAAAGGLFLAYWDFPVPSTTVEKTLPDARFPK